LLAPGSTVEAARVALAAAFRNAGLDTPQLDARILIGHALGVDHTGLATNAKRRLQAPETDAISALAVRRIAREPVARIIGYKEFWGLRLRVTPATLVPRPETEMVVEAALAAVDAAGPRSRILRIADLGTGTGALLLALLSELPNASGVATDISLHALEIARGNAIRLGLDNRAHFVAGDFGAALLGRFDLVVSNPPYVSSGKLPALAPEAASDPWLALEGGPDGLACYRTIAADARRLLAPSGELVVELGFDQERLVTALFRAQGLETSSVRPDLAGIPRALSVRAAVMAP
jgi:release factor glutamine methyltransferase